MKKIEETTFELDSDDPAMQRKAQQIQANTSIYDEEEDDIKITNETAYLKSDILELIEKKMSMKKKNPTDDYMKGIKKADREIEYDLNGPGWKQKDKPHKNKKKYDRKKEQGYEMSEAVYTKEDIKKMILERKYNGTMYSKKELIDLIKEQKLNLIIKLSDGSFSHIPENDKRNVYYNTIEEIFFMEYYISDQTPTNNNGYYDKTKKNEDNNNREST